MIEVPILLLVVMVAGDIIAVVALLSWWGEF